MSHRQRTVDQNVKLVALKAAADGDGDALDIVIPDEEGGVGGQTIEEDYYKAVAPGASISPTYDEVDDVDFSISGGDYLFGISAIFGGTMQNRDYGVRVLINGSPVGEVLWRAGKTLDERTMSLIEEVEGLAAGTLNVSIEAMTSDDAVYIKQWSVHGRKKELVT